jgi:tRNA(Ile)-lysidine synthase
VHKLSQKVLDYVRRQELLRAGDRLGLAVSGGADSVAMLRLLLELRSELGLVLSVVHFNHKLRGTDSESDERFVADLAGEHGLQFFASGEDVAQHAAVHHLSLEAAARKLRYGFFSELMEEALDKIATGHTMDDQAETLLMRVVRGTGMSGLRGIQPRLDAASGEIVRPLLQVHRREVVEYLTSLGQAWREDSSNRESRYTRNRVRQRLLPLIEKEFNPAITERLSELAEIARGEEDHWENEAAGWMGTVVQWVPRGKAGQDQSNSLVQISASGAAANQSASAPLDAVLDRAWLIHEPLAVQRRVIKAIGQHAGIPLEFKHVEEILRFGLQDGAGKVLVLPRGWSVERELQALVFIAPQPAQTPSPGEYEYQLTLPGRAIVRELGIVLEAVTFTPGFAERYDPEHLFDPALLARELVVRNWQPGDRFWPAHTKSARKVKELLQERHVGAGERKLWPVVVSGDEIVWVKGLPGRARLRPPEGKQAVLIRELAMEGS